jgi:phosphoglycolate phosphatase-like HAD superfamily hydrolase
MDDHTTTKLDAFRSIVQKSGALHAELATLDVAIRDLDGIKARISECRDEAEASQLIAAMRRAEETVTVKRLRESRLRDELAAIVKEGEFAHFEVISAIDAMLNDLTEAVIQPFRELLLSLQPEEENPKRDDANKVVLKALAPAVHVEDLLKMLRDAYRSVGVVTGDPYGPAKGLRAALEITDALLARIPEVHNERKRMTAACEAFRKVLAKG